LLSGGHCSKNAFIAAQEALEQAILSSPGFLQTHSLIRLREGRNKAGSEANPQADFSFGRRYPALKVKTTIALVFQLSSALQIYDRNQGQLSLQPMQDYGSRVISPATC